MSSMMPAVVKYGARDGEVELREVPVPGIGPGDVLLEVRAAGVCGSDIEQYRHAVSYHIPTPVTMGHEFAGVVAQVGETVGGWQVGDEVVSETAAHICGKCRLCRTGSYNMCPDRLGFGYGLDGAFASYVRVPARLLHHKPSEITWSAAALTEPACVAYQAIVVMSDLRLGEPVAILGPGAIGLMCLQVAKALGATPIMITGTSRSASRLRMACSLGADVVVNIDERDPVEVANEISGGEGIPLVLDAAGNAAATRTSLDIVARLGQITKLGWGPKPIDFSLDQILEKAVRFQGSFSHTWRTWEAVLEMMRLGTLDPEALISHELTIADWLAAYELVESRQAVKVILRPE